MFLFAAHKHTTAKDLSFCRVRDADVHVHGDLQILFVWTVHIELQFDHLCNHRNEQP